MNAKSRRTYKKDRRYKQRTSPLYPKKKAVTGGKHHRHSQGEEDHPHQSISPIRRVLRNLYVAVGVVGGIVGPISLYYAVKQHSSTETHQTWTREQHELSQKEAAREREFRERANIVIEGPTLINTTPGLTGGILIFTPEITMTIRNSGQRQAENLRPFGLVEILDSDASKFGRVNTKQKVQTRRIAPPFPQEWSISLGRALSTAERFDLAGNTSAIFAHVEIHYEDGFKKNRYIKCRLAYRGPARTGNPLDIEDCDPN